MCSLPAQNTEASTTARTDPPLFIGLIETIEILTLLRLFHHLLEENDPRDD